MKKILVCLDESYLKYRDGKRSLPLFNRLDEDKFDFIIFSNEKKKNFFYKKHINFINILSFLKNFYLLKKIIKSLYEIFQSDELRNKISKDNTNLRENIFYSIFKSTLIIIKDYIYFNSIQKNYDCLYVICYFNSCNLAPILSFKKNKKDVYDIQHGYIGDDHPAYEKKLINSKNLFVPNKMIIWRGEKYNGLPMNNLFTGDYPPKINIKKNTSKNGKLIIGFSMVNYQISNELIDFINSTNQLFIWRLKQHPMDKFEPYERSDIKKVNFNENIIVDSKSENIMSWLEKINIHISEFSSTVYEASISGIPTITNNKRLFERYRDHFTFENENNIFFYEKIENFNDKIKILKKNYK